MSLYSVLRLFCCFLNYILVSMIFRPGTKISWAFFLCNNLGFMLGSYNMHEYIKILVGRTLKTTKTSLIFNISTAFFYIVGLSSFLLLKVYISSSFLLKQNLAICKTFQFSHPPIFQSSNQVHLPKNKFPICFLFSLSTVASIASSA